MASQDRTLEFSQIVKSLSNPMWSSSTNSINKKLVNGNSAQKHNLLAQRSQFTIAARDISRDLTKTFTKVEKLALLTKKQSLFEDRGPEIQELTFIIKQDMASLSKQLIELQSLSRSQNSSLLGGGNNSQSTNHSQGVVKGLTSKLGNMRKQFEGLLKSHWESLKRQEERRGQFIGSDSSSASAAHHHNNTSALSTSASTPLLSSNYDKSTASSSTANTILPSRLLQDELRARNNQYLIDSNSGSSGGGGLQDGPSSLPHAIIDMQQAQQLSLLQDHTMNYLQSRNDAMSSIESTMHELGRIFTQLANLVKEQEESVIRIDTNIDTMQSNVENAHSELLRYFKGISNNRWLMFKVCGILLFFFIVFVLLFA